jgi:DNA polymerase-3 subunit epsilon
MVAWWKGTLAGFDLETTAPNPLEARAVTASVVIDNPTSPKEAPTVHSWLVAVDEPIPAAATEIHGVTTERAQAEGEPLAKVVTEISGLLAAVWLDGVPVVVYNAPYDFTVLGEERGRCGMRPLRLLPASTPILDPLVLDRKLDKYRRGSRQLGAVCKHYRVALDNAHTSDADCLAAVQVARCLGEAYQPKLNVPMQQLYLQQQVWYVEWAEDYERYVQGLKRRDGEPQSAIDAVQVNRQWPARTAHLAQAAGSR